MTVCMTSETLVTAATVEAISLCDVKQFIRELDPAPDQIEVLEDLIDEAIEVVQERQRSALNTQTRMLATDGFPSAQELFRGFRNPVQSVSSVKYYDTNGSLQTVGASTYVLDTKATFATVGLAYQQSWPSDCRGQVNDVEVTYVAGYGDTAADVPMRIRQLLKRLVTRSWEYAVPCCECPELDRLLQMDSFNVCVV
tara:strand:+ start:308 stop:898 length:591 start_codon:yes stop_codon:yes gene_type:complete